MTAQRLRQEIDFILQDLLPVTELLNIDQFSQHDNTTINEVLDSAAAIASRYFANHYKQADEQEPQFNDGSVATSEELKQAWQQYRQAGFISADVSEQYGGAQLPYTVTAAAGSLFAAANVASAAYPFLTSAAAKVIVNFGDDWLRQTFAEPMLAGRFSGTMALTEPDVGSSLGDLSTKATKQPDDSYRLRGNKIYISAGEHDLCDNIVHLVLARIEGAPKGSKGISLFVVPKWHVNPDGSLGERNDVQLAGLFHKMGYRGTSSTALNFGEQGQCTGYLLGQPHQGLRYMFQMMNEARIFVGIGAASLGYRGYVESLEFAKARPQGRAPGNPNPETPPVAIVEHSDVKRMLLAQKAYSEGALALTLYAASLMDRAHAGGDTDAALLLDLLTPVVKSFPSQYGLQANDLAIQVLGGAGYTREYNVEQLYRDNRLNRIHEGTDGIQSLDLLGRKLWQSNAKGLGLLMAEFQHTVAACEPYDNLAELRRGFAQHLLTVSSTVEQLAAAMQRGEVDRALANSALFLDMFSKLVVAWIWLRSAECVQRRYGASDNPEQQALRLGKLQAARYFIEWELPQIEHQARLLGEFNDSCAATEPDWF